MAKVKKDDATLIEDEVEAIDGYDKAISNETDPERKEVLEHIRDEEKEHIKEIEDMDNDKMTSDEAWKDFKSNYDKEEFDEAHKDDVTSGDSEAVTESKKVKNVKSIKKEMSVDEMVQRYGNKIGCTILGKHGPGHLVFEPTYSDGMAGTIGYEWEYDDNLCFILFPPHVNDDEYTEWELYTNDGATYNLGENLDEHELGEIINEKIRDYDEDYDGSVIKHRRVKNMKSTRKSTDAQNDSTLEGKLDTVASMINELETDVERTLDVIPQVEGQVAGEVAEGGEAEDDMFNVDSMFGDDAGEEGAVDEEGNPIGGEGEVAEGDAEGEENPQAEEQVDEDGNPIEADGDEGAGEETPAEDSIGDDQSSDEAKPDEETESDDEFDEDEEEDKLMESMVKTIVKQDKLIKSLTKRVEVLERNQKDMTVQKQSPARKVAIRHQPMYKSVGVVSKPPVQNGFNSQFNVGDDEGAVKSFKDPKALVANYKNKGIL